MSNFIFMQSEGDEQISLPVANRECLIKKITTDSLDVVIASFEDFLRGTGFAIEGSLQIETKEEQEK